MPASVTFHELLSFSTIFKSLLDIFAEQDAPKTVTWDMFNLLNENFQKQDSSKKRAINDLTIAATQTALVKARDDYKRVQKLTLLPNEKLVWTNRRCESIFAVLKNYGSHYISIISIIIAQIPLPFNYYKSSSESFILAGKMSNTSENLNVLCISKAIINKTASWLTTLSAEDQKSTITSALEQVSKVAYSFKNFVCSGQV